MHLSIISHLVHRMLSTTEQFSNVTFSETSSAIFTTQTCLLQWHSSTKDTQMNYSVPEHTQKAHSTSEMTVTQQWGHSWENCNIFWALPVAFSVDEH